MQDVSAVEHMEDLRFLTNKKTVLSSPGYALNDLYYSNSDSVIEATECTWSTGRYQYSLQNPSFGSSSQIIIPNSSFCSAVLVHLELPAIQSGQKLGKAWGYAA